MARFDKSIVDASTPALALLPPEAIECPLAVAHTVNSAAVRVVGAVRAPGAIHAPLRHTIRAAEATVGRRAVQRAAREAKQHLARAKLKPQFLAQLPFQVRAGGWVWWCGCVACPCLTCLNVRTCRSRRHRKPC